METLSPSIHVCEKCLAQKNACEFYVKHKQTGRLDNYCKSCRKRYVMEWGKKNPEKTKAWIKRWQQANYPRTKARMLLYGIGWRRRNLEWARERQRISRTRRIERTRELVNANAHLRRAVKRNAEAENFLRSEIYNRDGWICGICGKPVDSSLNWPDPMSVSLDHIVPVTKGGGHTRANTQCAHFGCNSSKRDRLIASTINHQR
jgi:hypothetical protein